MTVQVPVPTNSSRSALAFDLPDRPAKPRQVGITNLVDNGFGLEELRDKLDLCHPYVDIVKFGWGSAYLSNTLPDKVALLHRYGIRPCPGGLMFELSFWQDKTEDYAAWLTDHGFDLVEVSNGSLPIPEDDKRRMIEQFAGKGFTVLSEVGSKDVTVETPPEEWVACIKADIDCGAWKVISEGRADASAGIYRSDGSLREHLIESILDSDVTPDNLVFETPHKRQMAWFIRRVGPNVNLGNVPLAETMNLETLRLGLRGDTVQHFHAAP